MQDLAVSQPIDAIAGRVTKIAIPDAGTVSAIRILQQPEDGRLTVDPGGDALSYVSHDPVFSGAVAFEVELVRADGSVETIDTEIDVVPGAQLAGWATGENLYMLRTDDADEVVVETGDNHRKVYVSGSEDALSKADIEAIEGISIRDKKFGAWLADHPEYGGTEGMALDAEAAQDLWSELTGRETAPSSHWLLFERGYEYAMGRLIDRGTEGEDELHPIHVTAWGEGARPVLSDNVHIYQNPTANIVFSDLEFSDGFQALMGENMILEDVHVTDRPINVQNTDGVTIRQSEVVDVIKEAPKNADGWTAGNDRAQGIYVSKSDGVLIEDTFVSHTGWAEGYDAEGDPAHGQPPSMFSQNIYLQKSLSDVTFRDNISMEAASAGAQIRTGGFVEDNAFIDNNFGFSTGHGIEVGGGVWSGNYTLSNGNLVTSGAHKDGLNIGALTMGISDYSKTSVYTGNIVAHMANPDDPDEYLAKRVEHRAINENEFRAYDDTIIHNWDSWRRPNDLQERGTEDLDPGDMATTTIQRYAADLLGQDTATIQDLSQYLRDLTESGAEIDVDDLLAYFREGFGIEVPAATMGPKTATFVPDALADGVRWDNRLNWDVEILPMDGDSVELNGSFVRYGGSTDIALLDFGPGGTLAFTHGYLGVGEILGGGEVAIDRAGQFWTQGWDGEGRLDIDLDGGRFANAGTVSGAIELDAEDGQAILATGGGTMVVEAGAITLSGDDARVGFDGEGGAAVLRLEAGATLAFVAEKDGLGALSEFRSGAFEGSDVVSRLVLDGATLSVDISAYKKAGTHTLVLVDEIAGGFGAVDVTGLGGRDAVLRLSADGKTIELELVSNGSGEVALEGMTLQGAAPAPPGGAAGHGMVPEAPETPEAPSLPADPGLLGGAGRNILTGQTGDDAIAGGRGRDSLRGGEGDDTLDGGTGRDRLFGDDGDDLLAGGDGRDRLAGGLGDDSLHGGAGDDWLRGGDGRDLLVGGDGKDFLQGGAGDDTLHGGARNDRLAGEAGDDLLVGSAGVDSLRGGAGDDTLYGGADKDRLDGDAGDDLLVGGAGNDRLKGGAGEDALYGGEGRDRLYGGADDDLLEGGAGDDLLAGDIGDDRLLGGAGDDRLLGGAGADVFVGGLGDDRLNGGAGADEFVFDLSTGDRSYDQIEGFSQAEGDRIVIEGLSEEAELSLSVWGSRAILTVEDGGDVYDLARVEGLSSLDLQVIAQGDGYMIFG